MSEPRQVDIAAFHNDTPINSKDEDLYELSTFAEQIARSIRGIKNPIGTTIAINGSWGSGKSSVINLVREDLQKNNGGKKPEVVTSEFKSWWYQSEDALILAFLQNLNVVISSDVEPKDRVNIKDAFARIGKTMLQVTPAVTSIFAPGIAAEALSPVIKVAENYFFEQETTIENTMQLLSEAITELENKRFLIIIDDIDRMGTDEALAMFRLLKSVGHLPNIIYLLAYDRELAEKMVAERFKAEEKHFLEKIIQASFDMPPLLSIDIRNQVGEIISTVLGKTEFEQNENQLQEFFRILIIRHIENPRDIIRFKNAISICWPAIQGGVNCADFVALEIIRLFQPKLFKRIQVEKARLCGTLQIGNYINDGQKQRQEFLKTILEETIDNGKTDPCREALLILFPILNGNQQPSLEDNARCRVCLEAYLDTYFRLMLSEDAIATAEAEALIAHAGEQDFIQKRFLNAAKNRRRNGRSRVDVYLSKLRSLADQIEKEKLSGLLTTLFRIYNKICDPPNQEPIFDISVRQALYQFSHEAVNPESSKFSLSERNQMFINALKNAPFEWRLQFATMAPRHVFAFDQNSSESYTGLIDEQTLQALQSQVVKEIGSLANNGELANHDDLFFILFRWKAWEHENPEAIKSWTSNQLGNPHFIKSISRKISGIDINGGASTHSITHWFEENDFGKIFDLEALVRAIENLINDPETEAQEREIYDMIIDYWRSRPTPNQ